MSRREHAFAQDREHLLILEPSFCFKDQRARSEELLRKHLAWTHAPDERREMRRRIAEDLLSAASRDQSWSVVLHHLKRLRGLDFPWFWSTSADDITQACWE